MKKQVIKIIKRDAEQVLPPTPTAEETIIQQQQDKVEDDRDMASNVKTWITERRENNAAEELDAKNSLFAWNDEGSAEPA